MNGQKNILMTLGFAVSVSLIAAALSVLFVSGAYSRHSFDLLNAVCGEVVKEEPGMEPVLAAALKKYAEGNRDGMAADDILSSLGYCRSDISGPVVRQSVWSAAGGFLTGILFFMFTFLYRNKKESMRIRALTEYLEQVNIGKALVLSASGEDDFSRLEDEIYKTVTFLWQTREDAMRTKTNFADNLSNIAHQMKTPLTAVSLSVQMMKQDADRGVHLKQAEKQLSRLSHLEEALLVLARIDAGTLHLRKKEVDVFTLLVLAADHLQELSDASGVSIDIPEMSEMLICADPDWTMEAVMNLMKNCMEHSPGGTIRCACEQNPLYTEIMIRDDGGGFEKEDLPHLFERFYRGKHADGDGIGIGLSLSKEILERQNGTIQARNMPDGGACFEIRFYTH